MIFKEHKTNIQQILRIIPDGLLSRLAINSKVDYCAKVLQGERIFYLLLYSILRTDKISQRYLEEVFKSHHFKFLFNYSVDLKITHSSISERLSKINLDFFRQAYDAVYLRYNELYADKEQQQMQLIRVDSSMVAEAGTKLQKGMVVGGKSKNKDDKKQVKYTMAYDGKAICKAEIFTEQTYLCEDHAIPKVITDLIIKDKEHKNLYLFDRGVCSLTSFNDITANQSRFVCRVKTNRKMNVERSLITDHTNKDLGTLELLQDDIIYLFDGKTGLMSDVPYRRIIGKRKQELDTTPKATKGKQKKVENEIYFLTNDFDMTAQQIADYYKRRWDIEVFFRFIKQELNFKHFLSVNENGIQVMMYMTLIAAMMLMIYKKENGIGFTTAKRRLTIEVEDIVTFLAVLYYGGDISKYGKLDYYQRFIPK